ncbi:MAG: aminotransferase class III-fold pyridoxal phosphate-dependent enzyme, partial [Comamonadaceae bacterium]|nr:aminotransferase class III-fold pyridoxal phosphate-dependent enzyme [Comamonadaceae bacterium]
LRIAKVKQTTTNGIDSTYFRRGEPDRRRLWLSLAPDPNLVAQIPGGVAAPRGRSAARHCSRSRRARIGPSLSVSYRRPLTIVRGWMQHLYDADGRAYLDAVNNVPHVGPLPPARRRGRPAPDGGAQHEHALPARAARRRTPSGSAPRCPSRCASATSSTPAARPTSWRCGWRAPSPAAATTIVVDVGYHGNTNAVVEISPYKFNGPGGAGAPPHVHAVPMPDVYRGRYRAPDPEAGRAYAAHVAAAVRSHRGRRARRVGAFIAESILSCGGQIVLPARLPGSGAYRAVRAAGGVCIADEVQVGFGRVGTHFWAFETQGVVPDIVTMGKPIGNGHPLGAVVTTPEIAARVRQRHGVLQHVRRQPGLVRDRPGRARRDRATSGCRTHALRGRRAACCAACADAGRRHPLVGDVRGLGLFVGVELVRDRRHAGARRRGGRASWRTACATGACW